MTSHPQFDGKLEAGLLAIRKASTVAGAVAKETPAKRNFLEAVMASRKQSRTGSIARRATAKRAPAAAPVAPITRRTKVAAAPVQKLVGMYTFDKALKGREGGVFRRVEEASDAGLESWTQVVSGQPATSKDIVAVIVLHGTPEAIEREYGDLLAPQ